MGGGVATTASVVAAASGKVPTLSGRGRGVLAPQGCVVALSGALSVRGPEEEKEGGEGGRGATRWRGMAAGDKSSLRRSMVWGEEEEYDAYYR